MIQLRSNYRRSIRQNKGVAFLVDDDRGVLTALTRLLQAAGYRVKAYSSAEKFLGDHDPSVPGFVVLDVSMPELDGLSLQRTMALSGIERPIIFLTGHADVPACATAMKAGAIDFLVKPFKAAELFDAIQRAEEQDRINAKRRLIFGILNTLSQREREVLSHMITGKPNKDIAQSLGIAVKTYIAGA
jgi:FixJ family two-component response regulator